MTGVEKQMLRIARQYETVDAETIAVEIGMSAGYVTELCRSLIEKKFLTGSPAGYSVTRRWRKHDFGYSTRKPHL